MGVLCLILLRIHLEYEFEEVALKAALCTSLRSAELFSLI